MAKRDFSHIFDKTGIAQEANTMRGLVVKKMAWTRVASAGLGLNLGRVSPNPDSRQKIIL